MSDMNEAKKIISMFIDGETNAKVLAIEYLRKLNTAEQKSVQQTPCYCCRENGCQPGCSCWQGKRE